MTLRIAMWSGPRNISTAMMRAWENREDTCVIDEPFYAHYLDVTGLAHPGRDQVFASHERDADRVAAELTGPIPGGADIFYQKHMAHHLLPGMDRQWMESVANCFLIRNPNDMLLSLHARTPNPSIEDTGLPQQVQLFNDTLASTGKVPPVLDARDVLCDPGQVLGVFCDRLGVDFAPAMLAWPSGPRESDGAWAPYWYDAVEASTGFSPWRERSESVPPDLLGLLEDCQVLYRQLHAHRLIG